MITLAPQPDILMPNLGLDLANAKLVKVLNDNERSKYIALLIELASEKHPSPIQSVVLAEKTSFDVGEVKLESLFGNGNRSKDGDFSSSEIQPIEINDIYYRFVLKQNGQATIKFQIIHPATHKHISKYTKQVVCFVKETPSMYERIVEPYIRDHGASRLQWVQNILEEKSEMDDLVHGDRDPKVGFYLLYDSKWDRRNVSGLYLLALVKDPSIRSLRDLNGSHLGLLKNIRKVVQQKVPDKFPGILATQLRCFIHYQPTYYHFHVHVMHVGMEMAGAMVGQAHLLDDVIDNIESYGSDYYQRKTLYYSLGTEHDLYHQLSTTS